MKKLLSTALLICFALSITACQNEQNKMENYINNILQEEGTEEKNTNKEQNEITNQTETISIIYFNTNGGNHIEPAISDEAFEKLPTPKKENHAFLGWYLDTAFSSEIIYPYMPEGKVTLYAKWVKTTSKETLNNAKIKNWQGNSPSIVYQITPNGFDMEELQINGYKMEITVSYDVYYEKDYDVPLNIGYAGAPKYEASIKNSNNIGTFEKDKSTSSARKTRTISYTASISDLKNDKITLTFSTDNIQNVIHFSNIVITYECYK